MASRVALPATAFSKDPSKANGRTVDIEHLKFIRTLPSVISGEWGCEACHIRYGDPRYDKRKTPMARKPDDGWTVPMTPEEHRDQHRHNESEWWEEQGIDPLDIARKLYQHTGDTEKAIEIIKGARK